MSEPYVQLRELDLYVYGQVQCDFTVGGEKGFNLGQASLMASFKRTASLESELVAMDRVAKVRAKKMEELGNAMAIINAACSKFNPNDKDHPGATQEIEYNYTGVGSACAKYGITVSGVNPIPNSTMKVKLGDLQKIQAALKLAIDEEQNALQRTTSTMQNVMSKRDSATQLMTKVVQKFDNSGKSIIRNIGK